MIRFFIYKLIRKLNYYSLKNKKFPYKICSKYICEEINIINNYKNKIRNLLGYKIKKHKFKIINISIKTKESSKLIEISLIHRFNYIKNNFKAKSSEKIYLIIILKNINNSWFVVDICNKNIFPNIYEKLSKTDLFYTINKPIDIGKRLSFLKKQITSIECLNLNKKKQTINYNFRKSIYNSKTAVEYAEKYAFTYNSEYKSFDKSGGDCTNFISQCLYAGNIPLTKTWKPYSNSWIRVNDLYYYLINNNIAVDVTSNLTYKEGSIIQLYTSKKGYFSHSGIITKSLKSGEYLYCCHSYDKLNFPLSETFPVVYDKIRVIQPI